MRYPLRLHSACTALWQLRGQPGQRIHGAIHRASVPLIVFSIALLWTIPTPLLCFRDGFWLLLAMRVLVSFYQRHCRARVLGIAIQCALFGAICRWALLASAAQVVLLIGICAFVPASIGLFVGHLNQGQ